MLYVVIDSGLQVEGQFIFGCIDCCDDFVQFIGFEGCYMQYGFKDFFFEVFDVIDFDYGWGKEIVGVWCVQFEYYVVFGVCGGDMVVEVCLSGCIDQWVDIGGMFLRIVQFQFFGCVFQYMQQVIGDVFLYVKVVQGGIVLVCGLESIFDDGGDGLFWQSGRVYDYCVQIIGFGDQRCIGGEVVGYGFMDVFCGGGGVGKVYIVDVRI